MIWSQGQKVKHCVWQTNLECSIVWPGPENIVSADNKKRKVIQTKKMFTLTVSACFFAVSLRPARLRRTMMQETWYDVCAAYTVFKNQIKLLISLQTS